MTSAFPSARLRSRRRSFHRVADDPGHSLDRCPDAKSFPGETTSRATNRLRHADCRWHRKSQQQSPASSDAGFSLIEVIIALVLFSALFLALYRGIGGAGRAIHLANLQSKATHIAVARLAAAGVESALADGQAYSGDERGFTWRVNIERYTGLPDEREQFISQRTQTPQIAGYWVDVEVIWRPRAFEKVHSLRLRTLKLGGNK